MSNCSPLLEQKFLFALPNHQRSRHKAYSRNLERGLGKIRRGEHLSSYVLAVLDRSATNPPHHACFWKRANCDINIGLSALVAIMPQNVNRYSCKSHENITRPACSWHVPRCTI